ncbi:VOC family protein [Silanimonas sp.]|uniref:VOC family protein n=1 Tax=Silanimonas sp. TaxID=1929290 RepID=UPI0022C46595|nr:VOC family protein [Silanimonas sp.]MCZ8166634.1 VOC family protein [Silanimonas sp.]
MPVHTPSLGAPCWFELASTDPARSIAFAQAVFGWSADEQGMPTGPYAFMANSTAAVGAICGLPPDAEGAPSFWSAYFLVADVDASRAKAIALGATPFGEPFDAPGMGRGAVLADPGGAVFNLWQADASGGGDFAMFEDHSIGWVELATRDVDAAQRFYGELLGWTFKDSANAPAGTRYSEYAAGDTHYGGLLQMTAEWGDLPEHWSLYAVVPDLDAALAATASAGGSVSVPAFDAPGVGRIARIDDPTGAGLYLIELAR